MASKTKAKKAPAKKVAPKKPVAKKVAPKKPVAKKPVAKKPVAKKVVAKKVVAPNGKYMTPKVSPLKGMHVTDWVKSKTSGWQTEVIVVLLETLAKAAPKATVSIKWGQPVIAHNGPIAWVKPAKTHVAIGFWRGRELTGGDRLEGSGDRMAHLKVTSADALDAAWITELTREAVALNEKLGDPSKRAR